MVFVTNVANISKYASIYEKPTSSKALFSWKIKYFGNEILQVIEIVQSVCNKLHLFRAMHLSLSGP